MFNPYFFISDAVVNRLTASYPTLSVYYIGSYLNLIQLPEMYLLRLLIPQLVRHMEDSIFVPKQNIKFPKQVIDM
nr:MAG TPA: hypothetical protein [Caudoviricetes sp.]